MTTTFQSRELVRDELAALFVADGSWQEVYQYWPGTNEIAGKTPVLIIRSRGTRQDMAGVFTNPASYRFLVSSWTIAYSSAASITSSSAEDTLDTLDKTLRQIVRDNAGSLTNGDLIRFEEGYSEVIDVVAENLPYIVETRAILVDLVAGAV